MIGSVGLLLDLLPVLVIALLVLIPTRRLFLAGWSSSFLLTYYLFVCGLGALVAELRGPARYLVPILVLAYIAPFVTAGAGIARVLNGRQAGGATATPVVRRVRPVALPPPTASPPTAPPHTAPPPTAPPRTAPPPKANQDDQGAVRASPGDSPTGAVRQDTALDEEPKEESDRGGDSDARAS